jgi:hypothetical protein
MSCAARVSMNHLVLPIVSCWSRWMRSILECCHGCHMNAALKQDNGVAQSQKLYCSQIWQYLSSDICQVIWPSNQLQAPSLTGISEPEAMLLKCQDVLFRYEMADAQKKQCVQGYCC